MAEYEYKIGIDSDNLVYVEDILSTVCRGLFIRYPVQYRSGTGTVRGDGAAVAHWIFDCISQADLNTLRAYVTTADVYLPSKTVAIKTRTDDGVFGVFDCQMEWPDNEDLEKSRRAAASGMFSDVTITFTQLELVT